MTLCKVDFLKEMYTAYFQGEISESFFKISQISEQILGQYVKVSHSMQVVNWQYKHS